MFKKYFIIVVVSAVMGTLVYARTSLSPGERQDLIEEVESVILAVTSSAPVATSTTAITKKIEQPVPFTSQAPLAQWKDRQFQDGCEEASALMAVAWARGAKLGGPDSVTADILKMIAFETNSPSGYSPDVSANDTAEIIKNYFNYSNVSVRENVTSDDLISELHNGHVIITPVNGRLLNNPNFTAPGPLYHMLVIIGYNPATKEFITNDPGTRNGAKYRYPVSTFMAALRDYPSGHHEEIEENIKRIIVVSK
ncbi:MAG: hypothetical protein EXS55_02470 [Candidatus Magasanikbacteria bacterium]|nr:hypothetical protein [Candidatus Magasanikbacteria bacterium]